MCVTGSQRPSEDKVKVESEEVQPEVVYVDYGIANRFQDSIDHEDMPELPDRIEMNRMLLLPQYKELHDYILEHEKHHRTGGYSIHDFKLDYFSGKSFRVVKQYIQFIATNPKSWKQFLPYYKTEHGGYWDLTVIINYVLLAAGVLFLMWLI